MRDKYSYVPGVVPVGPSPAHARLALVHGYVINYFTQAKTARKAAAVTAVTQLQAALGAAPVNSVPAFRAYETAHLAIGNLSQAQLQAALVQHVQFVYGQTFQLPWGAPRGNGPRVDLRLLPLVNGNGVCEVQVLVREPPTAPPVQATVGRVYPGTERFEALGPGLQPANRQNDVYTRRGFPNQHYIRYQRGGVDRYVRRFVIRGLNQEDSQRITAGRSLVAPEQQNLATANEIRAAEYTGKHNVLEGTPLSDQQQILSHTRGWKKRFISTTTTMHPAYSTRGVEFRSVFGKVIVDLAFVPGANIFDLHTPEALPELNTTAHQVQTANHQPNPAQRTLHDEEILSGRDVVRTREVMIRWSVPNQAIRSVLVGPTVIGIWHPGEAPDGSATFNVVEAAWGHPAPYNAFETLDYRRNNRWYKFYHFANAGAALLAWNAIPLPAHPNSEQFQEYDFPNPTPLGFAR